MRNQSVKICVSDTPGGALWHQCRSTTTIMQEVDAKRKRLVEVQAEQTEDCMGQTKQQSLIASINDLVRQREDLTDGRMPEMTAILKERDPRADKRFKLMSELMHCRDTEANKRMGDLMTTMQDLTPRVKNVVVDASAVTKRPLPITEALNSTKILSTSGILNQKSSYQ